MGTKQRSDRRTRFTRLKDVSCPTRNDIVEPAAMANVDLPFLTQVLVLPPGLPVDEGGPFGTIVVSPMKESKGDKPQESIAKCDGVGGGSNNGGSENRISNGLFDNLGPKPSKMIKDLRLFNEICIELDNGATSVRQVGERFNERKAKHDYPLDLPCGITGASRGIQAALNLFRDLFVLDEKPQIFTCDPSKCNAVNGLTDFGRSLWRDTQSFLESCGVINKAA